MSWVAAVDFIVEAWWGVGSVLNVVQTPYLELVEKLAFLTLLTNLISELLIFC